jgi:serine/threonine protein kinase
VLTPLRSCGVREQAEAGPQQPDYSGHLTAAPCIAELAPAYRQWSGLYNQLLRQPITGLVPCAEPQTGRGGWLTACDLGAGRRLSDLMSPHGQVRGIGQRQAARVLQAVAEILLRLHKVGHSHGQVNLYTATLQIGPTGQQTYQLTPPPLPPVPIAQIEAYCTAWQVAGLAPEQLQGALPSPESDVYALGAMAFLLATGRPPFGELQQLRSMASGARSGRAAMVRLWLPEATQEFVEPVTRALALDPARRPTLAQFAEAMAKAEHSSRRAFAQTNQLPRHGQPLHHYDTWTDLGHAMAQRTAVEPACVPPPDTSR